MKFERDPWLGGVFGYEVFRLNIGTDEFIDPAGVFSGTPLPQRAFYYVKVPVTSVAQAGALTQAGFRVVDVNVTFERQPENLSLDGGIRIREAVPADEPGVLEIAGSAFVYSRFHLDPLLEKNLANRIKREWIGNYFRKQRGERLLVAEMNGRPAGFVALLVSGEAEKTGVIDLIGVAREMQGCGVGRCLVEYHVKDSCGKYSRLLVGTQIANLPSIRLYTKCGYSISNSAYVLHAHVSEGRIH